MFEKILAEWQNIHLSSRKTLAGLEDGNIKEKYNKCVAIGKGATLPTLLCEIHIRNCRQ